MYLEEPEEWQPFVQFCFQSYSKYLISKVIIHISVGHYYLSKNPYKSIIPYLEASVQSIFHNCYKLFIGEFSISIHIKQCEDCIDYVS